MAFLILLALAFSTVARERVQTTAKEDSYNHFLFVRGPDSKTLVLARVPKDAFLMRSPP